MAEVRIRYVEGEVDLNSLVDNRQRDFIRGQEIVTAGKLQSDSVKAIVRGKSRRLTGRRRARNEVFVVESEEKPDKCFAPLPGMSRAVMEQGLQSGWLCPPNQWPPSLQFEQAREGPDTTPHIPLPPSTIGGFIERTWAYMTVKKLIDQYKYDAQNRTHEQQLKDRALELSLKVK